jgi:hypothetical protein
MGHSVLSDDTLTALYFYGTILTAVLIMGIVLLIAAIIQRRSDRKMIKEYRRMCRRAIPTPSASTTSE